MATLDRVYRGLATLLRAGVLPKEAVATLRRSGTLTGALGATLARDLDQGKGLAAAFRGAVSDASAEEVALLEAGEESGHLDAILDRAAALRERRREQRRKLWTQLAYPVLLFHATALLAPIATKGVALTAGAWFRDVCYVLLPVYALAFAGYRMSRTPGGRRILRRILDRVPGFGAASRHRRRADFSIVLATAYQSGVPLSRAVTVAARAGRWQGESAAAAVAEGRPLSDALLSTGALLPEGIARIKTAETVGDLEDTLFKIAEEETFTADQIYARTMIILSRGIYVAVALWIAYLAISTLSSYYTPVFKLLR